MVMHAEFETGLGSADLVADTAIGALHGMRFEGAALLFDEEARYGVQRSKGRLDLDTGILQIGGVQLESPVLERLVGAYTLRGDLFVPEEEAPRGSFDDGYNLGKFPVLFELERMARAGSSLCLRVRNIYGDGVPFDEQAMRRDAAPTQEFLAQYLLLRERSALGKPIVEGFYRAQLRRNVSALERAAGYDGPMRRAYLGRVLDERFFAETYGAPLLSSLKDTHGLPRLK